MQIVEHGKKMDNNEIVDFDRYFERAFEQFNRLKKINDEYASMIQEEYDNCNLFFLKSYLEMFKSEINMECIDIQLQKLELILIHARRAIESIE